MKTTLATKLATAAAATGLAFAAVVGVAGPAGAATETTFEIATGGLAITMPSSGALTGAGATVATGAATAAGQLGVVTVADTRGLLVNAWTSGVSSTTFVTGTSSANETVAKTNIAYSSGTGVGTGLGTFVPSISMTLATDGGPGAAWTGAAGNNTTTWNPTLSFVLLSSQVSGVYTGTVTHSIA